MAVAGLIEASPKRWENVSGLLWAGIALWFLLVRFEIFYFRPSAKIQAGKGKRKVRGESGAECTTKPDSSE